jgi:5-methylcytosine-specific restriction enzyme subunit McrC
VIRELAEWKTCTLEGVALTDEDRRLLDRLKRGEGPRLVTDELVTGLRVQAKSWVGVVQLSSVRIHVVPKLAGEHLGVLRMLDWTSGLEALKSIHAENDLELEGASLLDLVALLFVRATERIARGGLRTAYVENEDALGVLRGRLLFERQLRRRQVRLDRLECRYDERSADIFDNRLLLAAAERCATRAGHTGVRRRAARLRMILADVCDARDVGLPRREPHYDRLNRRYRPAHELAWIVLEGTQGLEDLYAWGATRSFAFMIDMNQIFERFVEQLLTEALAAHGFPLRFQKRTSSVVQRPDGSAYLRLIPDALARIGQPPVDVPIDAKYKRYSNRKLDRDDIAQAFIYAAGLGATPDHGTPHALLVYPSESGELESTPLFVRHIDGTPRAALTALGIPVAGVLDEVAADGDALIGAIGAAVLSAGSAGLQAPVGR